MYYNKLMIELNIPGRGRVQLDHLVLDVNGTLALDGKLLDGIPRALNRLRDRLQIHLITADTHGGQDLIDRQLNVKAIRLQPGDEASQKAAYVRSLDASRVVAIGQGANDARMLKEAAIGVCILSREGLATASLTAADLIAPDIFSALEMLENPLRIVASLRQ
jgi:P-type E1-E2 ATPase